ncbi:hypothetical protein ACWDRB_58770 [Nonomuraea sp. NPDC003707]
MTALAMLTKFWEAIGGRLADRWISTSLPALIFWFGGLLAWLYGKGETAAMDAPLNWLGGQSEAIQIGVLLGGLLCVGATGVVVSALTAPVLRLMEGYWPAFLEPLRTRLTDQVKRRVEALDTEFQKVAGLVDSGTATPKQQADFIELDQRLRRFPANESYLPTRIGNILRAAEYRPTDKYGLDAVAVWSHLWLLLPAATQQELAAARTSLDKAVATFIWGLLFVLFAPINWWAVPVGLIVATASWRLRLPPRAEVFADLVEAVFDLHRTALYKSLRWPLPADPRAERAEGRRLTTYLLRGLDEDTPTFTPQSP